MSLDSGPSLPCRDAFSIAGTSPTGDSTRLNLKERLVTKGTYTISKMSHRPSLIDIDMMIYDIIINGISLSRSISLTEYPFFSTYQYMDYNMVIEHHISKGPRKRQFSTLPCNLPFWSLVPQNVVHMNISMTGFIHVNGEARFSWNTWYSTEMSAGIELHEHGRWELAQPRSFL